MFSHARRPAAKRDELFLSVVDLSPLLYFPRGLKFLLPGICNFDIFNPWLSLVHGLELNAAFVISGHLHEPNEERERNRKERGENWAQFRTFLPGKGSVPNFPRPAAAESVL